MRWTKKEPKAYELVDRWFAWHPVWCGGNTYAWLERVWRTRYYDGKEPFAWFVKYRVYRGETDQSVGRHEIY